MMIIRVTLLSCQGFLTEMRKNEKQSSLQIQRYSWQFPACVHIFDPEMVGTICRETLFIVLLAKQAALLPLRALCCVAAEI